MTAGASTAGERQGNLLGLISPRSFAIIGIIAFVLIHLARLNAPPSGYHAWRESDTASVALNYFQEDFTFSEPRINQRGDKTGITGMEFPIYCYVTAALYFVFGPTHAVPHVLTLLAALVAFLALFALTKRLFDESIAALAVWALAFSPLFFFYSYKIMPDLWMLALWIVSIALFFKYRDTQNLFHLALSALTLAVSAMIKPLGLCAYLLFLVALIPLLKSNKRLYVYFPIFVAVTFLPAYFWFQFSNEMIELYGAPFYLGDRFGSVPEYLFNVNFFKRLLWQWPIELWIGWSFLVAFFIGIWRLRKQSNWKLIVVWIIAVYLVFAATAQMSSTHDYYSLIATVPFAVVTAIGLKWMSTRARATQVIAVILLLSAPVSAYLRIENRLGDTQQFDEIRTASDKHIPSDALVIVEDDSQPIRLYQLNRKGWFLRGKDYSATITQAINRGAEYLILNRSIDEYNLADSTLAMVDTNAIPIGPLYAYPAARIVLDSTVVSADSMLNGSSR